MKKALRTRVDRVVLTVVFNRIKRERIEEYLEIM